MTDEERARSILKELEYDFISYGNMKNDDSHGLSVIKRALRKTIPMKPSCISVDWFQCPCCRNRFGYDIRRVAMLYKYCPSCGQAIDWSMNEG